MPNASEDLQLAFAILAVFVAAGFIAGIHRSTRASGASGADARRTALRWAIAVIAWLAFTGLAAHSGRLRFDTMPPTMILLVVVALILSFRIALSRTGERLALGLPLALLVGFQAFRLPLELAMHGAYEQGIMPVQMSYDGYNFDIVTGLTALPIAALLATGQLPLWVVRAWNAMGALLLANVLTIAILSTPTPLRVFDNEPTNTWITHAPFVWLPAVLVPAAIMGHVVIFRRLRRTTTTKTT